MGEAYIAVHVRARRRRRLIRRRDGGDLARVDRDAASGDKVAAELALRGLQVSVESVVPQRLEHRAHVREMLLARLEEDEDVVAAHLHKLHARARRADSGSGPPGLACPIESNDKAQRPKIECMERIRTGDIPCRLKAPTRNSYRPPGTRNDVLCWYSSRM